MKSVKPALRVAWHLVRYTIATCASTAVSAALPLVIAFTPLGLAVMWVLAWVAALVFYALTGEAIDLEMDSPLGIVLVPLLLLLFGIACVSAVLLLAIAFNVLAVLPISLITEFVCRRLRVRAILPRLGIFLVAGLLLGITLAGIAGAAIAFGHFQVPPVALPISALALLAACAGAVFTSGLVLTMLFPSKGHSDGTLFPSKGHSDGTLSSIKDRISGFSASSQPARISSEPEPRVERAEGEKRPQSTAEQKE